MAGIKVLQAIFASANKGFDVTEICQNLVSNGNDDIPVNIKTFGDPDPGKRKGLQITYTTDKDTTHAMTADEGTTIDLVLAQPKLTKWPIDWPLEDPDTSPLLT